jgi:hypothetical protein
MSTARADVVQQSRSDRRKRKPRKSALRLYENTVRPRVRRLLFFPSLPRSTWTRAMKPKTKTTARPRDGPLNIRSRRTPFTPLCWTLFRYNIDSTVRFPPHEYVTRSSRIAYFWVTSMCIMYSRGKAIGFDYCMNGARASASYIIIFINNVPFRGKSFLLFYQL